MNFSTDRDLLIHEPNLFSDVINMSQQRLSVTDGALTGTTLTSATADFVGAQIDVGNVLLIAGVPHEVISRTDSHTLTVSLLRSNLSNPPIPSINGALLAITCRTYHPQTTYVHDLLLRMIGIELDNPANQLNQDSIVSISSLQQLEIFGTLERIYSSAINSGVNNDYLLIKANYYKQQFARHCRGSVILLDSDGDGYADLKRNLGLVAFARQ